MSAPLKLGLLGHPVSHSLSPVLHQTASRLAGVEVTYTLLDTPQTALRDRVKALEEEGYTGFNVTVPHKEAVVPLMKALSPIARRLGAVNTATALPGGGWEGHNTDVGGFQRALVGRHPEGRAVILGAGGSARAVAAALEGAPQVTEIILLNRNQRRAESLVSELALERAEAWPTARTHEALEGAALWVSTLPHPLWRQAAFAQLARAGARRLSPRAAVCDIAYGGGDSPLLQAARARGLHAIDGLGMLTHQGLLSFERWTRCEPITEKRVARIEAAVRAAAPPNH